jgi:hypothetical protein
LTSDLPATAARNGAVARAAEPRCEPSGVVLGTVRIAVASGSGELLSLSGLLLGNRGGMARIGHLRSSAITRRQLPRSWAEIELSGTGSSALHPAHLPGILARPGMADVFLSYARSDREFVRRLHRALEDCGLFVWWDRDLVAVYQFPSGSKIRRGMLVRMKKSR